MRFFFLIGILFGGMAAMSCGVKAPPLPPIAVTPQQSEMRDSRRPSPRPSGVPLGGGPQERGAPGAQAGD
ncbi:MAG TPA: hypothetical protein VJB59_16390 [Bdellovibrionota bacterium]|nr:hypothetical protein [Bdellovibrionota bacterium]